MTGRLAIILILLVALAGFALAEDAEPIIANIIVDGGITLTLDTVAYYLGLEAGDPLDMEMISSGFHRFWESGLVEDLQIEIEELDGGEVNLIVTVIERPFLTSVIFEGNKKVSTTDIKDRLDEHGIELPRNMPLRMALLIRVQSALKEIYDAAGYRSAHITYEIEEVSASKRRVVYRIDEGTKVKIKELDFIGNEVFSDKRLRHALKLTKKATWYRPFGKKTIFSDESWPEDRENLRSYYLDRGYKNIKVGQPDNKLVARKPDAKTLKKKDYSLNITIPVEEGEIFSVGEVRVEGVKIFKSEGLQSTFAITPGDVYSKKVVEKGMETIREFYHNSGYIYAYTNQVLTDKEGEENVVDIVIDVFEGERFRLGRLEFSGNDNTRDKVLRREFRVAEGAFMNMGLLRASVFKVNALGYWKLEEDPLEFDFDDENKIVNVTVKGNEVGRNDLQFGAGYSELDGFFGQVMFNTRNFMGRGQTLGVSAQVGGRADYYSLSFSEPYFLDRRILLGASVFKTNQNITDYYRTTTGASATLGFGVSTFASVSFMGSLEDTYSRYAISRFGFAGDDSAGHTQPIDIPYDDAPPIERTYEIYEGTIVSLTPSYNMDSRDDPFDPNRGKRLSLRLRMAGGPLGGDFDYIRPEATFTAFYPVAKKQTAAFNVEIGQFFPYNNSEIPL